MDYTLTKKTLACFVVIVQAGVMVGKNALLAMCLLLAVFCAKTRNEQESETDFTAASLTDSEVLPADRILPTTLGPCLSLLTPVVFCQIEAMFGQSNWPLVYDITVALVATNQLSYVNNTRGPGDYLQPAIDMTMIPALNGPQFFFRFGKRITELGRIVFPASMFPMESENGRTYLYIKIIDQFPQTPLEWLLRQRPLAAHESLYLLAFAFLSIRRIFLAQEEIRDAAYNLQELFDRDRQLHGYVLALYKWMRRWLSVIYFVLLRWSRIPEIYGLLRSLTSGAL